jgi:hypothetical protein
MAASSSKIYLSIVLAAGIASAQIAPPQVRDNLRAPASEAVLLKALGKGKQIYACQASAQDKSKFEWVLARPQADLYDAKGEKIGKHYEGPTWEANDGGKVTGEVQQRAQAPRAGAVPWLLLKAKTTEGPGTFGRVTYIQRVNTMGGAAPAEGCDRAHAGKEAAVDYQADYYFYGPRR